MQPGRAAASLSGPGDLYSGSRPGHGHRQMHRCRRHHGAAIARAFGARALFLQRFGQDAGRCGGFLRPPLQGWVHACGKAGPGELPQRVVKALEKEKGGLMGRLDQRKIWGGSESDPDSVAIVTAAFMIIAIMMIFVIVAMLVEIPIVGMNLDTDGGRIVDSPIGVPAIAFRIADYASRGGSRGGSR